MIIEWCTGGEHVEMVEACDTRADWHICDECMKARQTGMRQFNEYLR